MYHACSLWPHLHEVNTVVQESFSAENQQEVLVFRQDHVGQLQITQTESSDCLLVMDIQFMERMTEARPCSGLPDVIRSDFSTEEQFWDELQRDVKCNWLVLYVWIKQEWGGFISHRRLKSKVSSDAAAPLDSSLLLPRCPDASGAAV